MAKCKGPVRPLIQPRLRGLSGPLAQNIGNGRCVHTAGNFIGVGGGVPPGPSPSFTFATPDPVTGEMLMQGEGTGPPVHTHTADILQPEAADVGPYHKRFLTNEVVWRGGRAGGGQEARDALIAMGWTITDGGPA